MLLSEGRYSTQISSVPSEHTDTSGIVLNPHNAKNKLLHLGTPPWRQLLLSNNNTSWKITSKAKDVATTAIHHEISHCGREQWLESSFRPTRMLPVMYSSSPQSWPYSHALCHT